MFTVGDECFSLLCFERRFHGISVAAIPHIKETLWFVKLYNGMCHWCCKEFHVLCPVCYLVVYTLYIKKNTEYHVAKGTFVFNTK